MVISAGLGLGFSENPALQLQHMYVNHVFLIAIFIRVNIKVIISGWLIFTKIRRE